MSKNKNLDIIILVILLVLAPVLSIILKANLFVSILLFYGLPAVWLSMRIPKLIKKASIISLCGTLIFFIVDYFAATDGSWIINSIFKYHLLNLLTFEDSLFMFLGTYLIVLFYEYFDDNEPKKKQKTRIKWLVALIAVIFIIFFGIRTANTAILNVPYAYAWILIIVALLPITLVLAKYPALRYKFLKANLYLAGVNFLFELTTLKLNQWSFPGKHFIGWVQVLGFHFPIEEFIFYITTAGVTLLVYYEFFYDDCR